MSTITPGPSAILPFPLPPSTPTLTSSTSTPTPTPITQTTTPTTTATATTSTSSLSSSTGASSSTSSTSSSSTSSTASSSTSSISTTPSTSKPIITTSSSNIPAVVTEVSTTFISESQSSTPTAVAVNNSSTGNAFFQNKGAVAGVFSVVGLVGLVIIIALVTNAIRRRQARKFDKELFLATQEAAATAPNPNFLDDEDDEPKRTGYSDVSHGTYGQPPMEAFTMRDMGSHSTAIGEIYDPYATGGGGAAGIGVARARSARVNPANAVYNSYAAALQEGGSPYPQFAMGPHDTYGSAGVGGPFGRGNMELGATVIPSGQQQAYPQRSPPPQEYTDLGRSKSNSTAATHLSTPSQSHSPNYSQSQPSYPVRQMSPPVRQMSPPRPTPTPANLPNPYAKEYPTHKVEPSGGSADDAAYGGYVVDDVDEEEAPKRVLKIANES